MVSEANADRCVDAGVIHHINNTSDHAVIYTKLSGFTDGLTNTDTDTCNTIRPSWSKQLLG